MLGCAIYNQLFMVKDMSENFAHLEIRVILEKINVLNKVTSLLKVPLQR